MAPPKRPWFRVYVEMVHDRKIRRLSPEHRWLWVTVLACARTSPVAGTLLLSDSVPYSDSDLADEAALPTKAVVAGLKRLEDEGLVERDTRIDAWVVPKWMERQYESDVTADRVRKHRYIKGRSNDDVTADVTAKRRRSNADRPPDVTSFSRAPATESESESESDLQSSSVLPVGTRPPNDHDDDDKTNYDQDKYTPDPAEQAVGILADRDIAERKAAADQRGLPRIGNEKAWREQAFDRRRAEHRRRLVEVQSAHPDWTPEELADAVTVDAPASTTRLLPPVDEVLGGFDKPPQEPEEFKAALANARKALSSKRNRPITDNELADSIARHPARPDDTEPF